MTSPFPSLGTYIVFRLNPVMMVAQFDDEASLAAARALPTKKYVAYVRELGQLNPPQPWHWCSLRLVGRGLPTWPNDELMEDDMYVPIFPATNHPSREPIRATPQFPFPDCYHWSQTDAVVRIPFAPYDESVAVKLPLEEMRKHEMYVHADFLRWRALSVSSMEHAHTPTGSEAGLAQDKTGAHVAASITARCDPVDSNQSMSSASSYSMTESDLAMNEGPQEKRVDIEMVPTVALTLHLMAADTFGDPNEYYAELAVVRSLVAQAKARAMKRAHLDALLRARSEPTSNDTVIDSTRRSIHPQCRSHQRSTHPVGSVLGHYSLAGTGRQPSA
ncbi:hypothetical protein B0H21DRAFT_708855 [Amylocystis lapponica]|nr:hypothetical protein B0H21DRAFT_708855 [Amylocystis lapponica]